MGVSQRPSVDVTDLESAEPLADEDEEPYGVAFALGGGVPDSPSSGDRSEAGIVFAVPLAASSSATCQLTTAPAWPRSTTPVAC
jgi:hypothetical protein